MTKSTAYGAPPAARAADASTGRPAQRVDGGYARGAMLHWLFGALATVVCWAACELLGEGLCGLLGELGKDLRRRFFVGRVLALTAALALAFIAVRCLFVRT